MVRAFEKACGQEPIPYTINARRPGDIAVCYAATELQAERELGWKATRGVDQMCADAWRWQRGNPLGYPD